MTANTPFTAATYDTETEAVLAMQYLESHGIKATIAGSAPTELVGNYYGVPLGYTVQVCQDDSERAYRLLDRIWRRRMRRHRVRFSRPLPRWLYLLLIASLVLTVILILLNIFGLR
jgi:hypothetical protein